MLWSLNLLCDAWIFLQAHGQCCHFVNACCWDAYFFHCYVYFCVSVNLYLALVNTQATSCGLSHLHIFSSSSANSVFSFLEVHIIYYIRNPFVQAIFFYYCCYYAFLFRDTFSSCLLVHVHLRIFRLFFNILKSNFLCSNMFNEYSAMQVTYVLLLSNAIN